MNCFTRFQLRLAVGFVFLLFETSTILAVNTSSTRTINVTTAGKLSTLLPEEERQYVVSLTLTGKLNGTDFKILRTMATDLNLQTLDLSGANIVSGGDPYYTISSINKNYYTSNNEAGYCLFGSCKKIQKIVLPNSLTTLGDDVFYGCSDLRTLIIGSKVTSIGGGLWFRCPQLSTVQINNNSSFHLSNGILYNKDYTFIIAAIPTYNFGKLTFRSSVKSIQAEAFACCSKLTSVSIPTSITAIYSYTFSESGISSVTFSSSITKIYSDAFEACKNLKQVDLRPTKITSLDWGAFDNSNIEVVYLPKTLTELKQYAFARNPLKHIFAYTATPATMYDFNSSYASFKNVDTSTCVVHVPTGKVSVYKAATGWKDFQYITDSQEIESVKEEYAVYTDDGTLTFFYDNLKESRNGKKYSMNTGEDKPEWEGYVSAKKVVFDKSFSNARPTSTYRWFLGHSLTEIVGIENLNTSEVTNMSNMFWGCNELTSLDVSHFNTAKVTDMSGMFAGCHRLKTLDVSHFDTSNVTNFEKMFSYCISLTNLVVTHFNTGKATNMSYMFYQCSDLTNLDVSRFDTRNVTNMAYMFNCCFDLTSIDVSHFDTGNVTNMSAIFAGCKSLKSLDVTHFDTNKTTNMGLMFSGCSSLANLDVTHFNTSNVTNMSNMFPGCSSLTSLDLSNFDTSKVTNMSNMFSECTGLTDLNLSSFDTNKVMDMFKMFLGCTNLTTIYCGDNWDIENVTNSYFMFSNCLNLIGGKGTVFDENHIDASYAHVDGGPSNPGYLTDINATQDQEKIYDSDDLQAFIDGLVNSGDKGTADNPKKIPVAEDGLTIDKDVNVDDDLQLFIDGLANGGTHIAFIDNSNINIRHGGCVLRIWNSVFSSSATKSNAKGVSSSISQGGILNEGTLTLAACTLDEGQYTMNNLSSGCLMLKDGTTVNSMQNIENSGTLYIDGTCTVKGLLNRHGGRILLTSRPTQPINVTITDASDVEEGQPIVFGTEGYTLTEADADKLVIEVPDGYVCKYDEMQDALVVSFTSGISTSNADHVEVAGTYDLTGRRTESPKKGLSIQRMNNGIVKKVIMK